MKIAFIIKYLDPASSSRAPIELAKKLAANHQIALFAYDFSVDKNCRFELEKQGIKVILIQPSSNPILKLVGDSWRLRKEIKTFHPDIISFHSTLPFFIGAKLTGFPLIKTYYGTQIDAYLERLTPDQKPNLQETILNRLANFYIKTAEVLQFKLANEVVGISLYTANEGEKLYHRKIPFVYLGADSENFLKKIPASCTKKDRPFTILSVSRLTPYKGFHQLIEMVKEAQKKIKKPMELIIAGPPEKKSYLQYLKKRQTENIKILPGVSESQLYQLYQQCDLYATADRYLFFGLTPLEAALFGKPTLALNYCAAPEIISHQKTGLVADNLAEMKTFLIQLITNQNLKNRLGQNAKIRAEKEFTWQKTAKEYETIFKKYET